MLKPVKVEICWFSSGPTIEEALKVLRDIYEDLEGLRFIREDESVIMWGATEYGPHSTLIFMAKNIVSAVKAADTIRNELRSRFPDGCGKGTGGMYIRLNGKHLYELLEVLDDLQKSCIASFFLSKRSRKILESFMDYEI